MDSQFCSQCLQAVPKENNQLMICCKHEDEDGYPIIKEESSCSTSPELSPTPPEFAPTPQKRVRFSSSPEDELKSKSQRRFMRRKSIDNQRSILKQRPSKRVPSQSNYKSTVYTAIGGIDPFNTLNVDQDVKTDIALHHWTTCFQQLRMPLTPRPQWLRICLSDPVILAVTICTATSHFYFFRGMRVPTATYISQKVKAIRAINDALKLPDSIPNDYTIIAVAVMTVLECLAGEPTAWAIHRQGLDKMIKSRGGIQNLGLDDMVQRTVSWADTSCAILLRRKPSFEPTLITDAHESSFPPIHDTPYADSLHARLIPLTASHALNNDIAHIYLRLRQLTAFIDQLPQSQQSAIDACFFTDKLDAIQRQAMAILHSPALSASPSIAFLTAFLNAMLIYIYGELRQVSKYTKLCVALSSRIRSGLEMVDLGPAKMECADLVMFTLLLGRSSANPMGGPDKSWFGEQVLEMAPCGGVPGIGKLEGMRYFDVADHFLSREKSM